MEVKAKELRIGNWINECEMSYLGTKVTIEHNDKIIQDAFDLQTIDSWTMPLAAFSRSC